MTVVRSAPSARGVLFVARIDGVSPISTRFLESGCRVRDDFPDSLVTVLAIEVSEGGFGLPLDGREDLQKGSVPGGSIRRRLGRTSNHGTISYLGIVLRDGPVVETDRAAPPGQRS